MPTTDPRIDAYIAKSAEFAQPLLRHFRAVVHAGCPDVVETMKWSRPFFEHHGTLCYMSSFKAHCGFGFQHSELVLGTSGGGGNEESMGDFGRVVSIGDLPPEKVLLGYVRKAAKLNEAGVKPPPKKKAEPKAPLEMSDDFAAALKRNKAAQAAFEKFSPSARREYLEWVTSAKREETRAQRITTAIEWIAEGKSRNWKYERK